MKWKNRLTNYNFWISIISAVLLIFQAFDIDFDIAYINEIATAVLGLLVVIGIISDPTKTFSKTESEEEKNEKTETVPIESETENAISDAEVDLQNFINELSLVLENYQTEDRENVNVENLTPDEQGEKEETMDEKNEEKEANMLNVENAEKSVEGVNCEENANLKIVN